MSTIKEIQIQSIGEPYQVKIERNSKGYNYEVGVHAEDAQLAVAESLAMRKQLESALYGTNTEPQ